MAEHNGLLFVNSEEKDGKFVIHYEEGGEQKDFVVDSTYNDGINDVYVSGDDKFTFEAFESDNDSDAKIVSDFNAFTTKESSSVVPKIEASATQTDLDGAGAPATQTDLGSTETTPESNIEVQTVAQPDLSVTQVVQVGTQADLDRVTTAAQTVLGKTVPVSGDAETPGTVKPNAVSVGAGEKPVAHTDAGSESKIDTAAQQVLKQDSAGKTTQDVQVTPAESTPEVGGTKQAPADTGSESKIDTAAQQVLADSAEQTPAESTPEVGGTKQAPAETGTPTDPVETGVAASAETGTPTDPVETGVDATTAAGTEEAAAVEPATIPRSAAVKDAKINGTRVVPDSVKYQESELHGPGMDTTTKPKAGDKYSVQYAQGTSVTLDASGTPSAPVTGSDGGNYQGKVTYKDASGQTHEGYMTQVDGHVVLSDESGARVADTTGCEITSLNENKGSITYKEDGTYTIKDYNGVEVEGGTVTEVIGGDDYYSKADGYTTLSHHDTAIETGVKREDGKTYFSSKEALVANLKSRYPNLSDAEIETLASSDSYAIDETLPPATGGESATPWATSEIARENGVGSHDRPDVHDEFMHETHVTQKTGSDDAGWNAFGNMNDETGKAVEGYNADLGSGGTASTRVTLASNPKLTEIINTTGNPLLTKDTSKFSKLDYIATYAASGQYDSIDLKLMVDALEASGVEFEAHPAHYFKGTILEDKFNILKQQGGKFSYTREDLEAEIAELRDKVKQAHDTFISWEGGASAKEKEAIETIIGKFEVTMGNIDNALGPACDALDELYAKLEELQKGEEELFALTGEDGDGAPVGDTGKSLRELNKKLETLKKEEQSAIDNYSSIARFPVYKKKEQGTETDGSPHMVSTNEYTDAYAASLASAKQKMEDKKKEVADLEKEIADLEVVIEQKKTELDGILEEAIKLYYDITSYETTLDTFESFFYGGINSKRQRGATYQDRHQWIESKDSLLSHHDSTIKLFEDYHDMPVITPISGYYVTDESGHSQYVPYKIGDVLIHDDAHGYYYAVTGEFDPLTGTIRIACFDKYGKKIGSDITIWDQREIVPIRYVREFDSEYASIPDNFSEPLTNSEPETEKKTEHHSEKPTGGHGTEPKTDGTEPKTQATEPKTDATEPKTEATEPKTEATEPRTEKTEPPTYEPVTIPTDPQTETPGPGPGPHTGLDAMYSANGETKQSTAGLGALAGLAVGAAGLGLTGLVDDKKDKKDEEKDEKMHDVREENPMFSLNHPIEVEENPMAVDKSTQGINQ